MYLGQPVDNVVAEIDEDRPLFERGESAERRALALHSAAREGRRAQVGEAGDGRPRLR